MKRQNESIRLRFLSLLIFYDVCVCVRNFAVLKIPSLFTNLWTQVEFDFSEMAALANEQHAECGEKEFLIVLTF